MITYAANQTLVQRYMACKNLKTAKRAIYLNIPLYIILMALQVMIAIVSYAYFAGCDPVVSGKIPRYDVVFPYLVTRLFEKIPVFTGLFISVIFAAALSTISSGLNSLAFVSIVDIFLPIHKKRVPDSNISPKRLALISRLVAVGLGVLSILIAIIFNYAKINIFRIIINMFSVTGGAIFTLLTMGIFFPFINKWGGLSGFIISFFGTLWVAAGNLMRNTIDDIPGRLPTNESCTAVTQVVKMMRNTLRTTARANNDFSFYDLSYLWLTTFSLIIGLIAASIVSLATGMNSKRPIRQSLMAKQAVSGYRSINWCAPQSYDDSSPFIEDEEDDADSTSQFSLWKSSVDDAFLTKF